MSIATTESRHNDQIQRRRSLQKQSRVILTSSKTDTESLTAAPPPPPATTPLPVSSPDPPDGTLVTGTAEEEGVDVVRGAEVVRVEFLAEVVLPVRSAEGV